MHAAALSTGAAACDQAVGELARLIAVAGAAGGDDVAAEVLSDVWRAAGRAAARQQERLRAKLAAAKQRAAAAAAAATEAAAHRHSQPSRGSHEGSISGKEGAGGNQGGEPGAAVAECDERVAASGEAVTQPFIDQNALSAAIEAATTRLKEENARLEAGLAACRRDLAAASQRAAVLESLAADAADAEARAGAAEAALEEAQRSAGTLTPRPAPSHAELRAVLGEEDKVETALAAVQELSCMPPQKLAVLLTTAPAPAGPATEIAPPAAAAAPAAQEQATTTQTLSTTPSPPTSRFAGTLAGAPAAPLAEALARARGPTASRYASLEAAAASLRSQAAALATELETHREAERRREAARRRREEEAALDRKNAVQQYLDLLSSQGEEEWREQLIGMGQGPEVPKLFRHSGKIRNKGMSKRDTEKLVKELWKERLADPAVSAGRAGELVDFVGAYLQKRVGIAAAVIETGYNFLYGLWQYQWDADCELFLKILAGEIREEVYVAAARLQSDLEDLFAALDRASGRASGILPKEDLRTALNSFFRVGAPGGKSLERFDEVMQALDADQPGAAVEWKKVFEEDREFNQGEFAECLRDQFLKERIEFFKALEEALYEEAAGGGGAGGDEECTRAQVVRAVLQTDPECSEKAAAAAVGAVFVPGTDTLTIKVAMRKLSRGIMRGGGMDDRAASLGSDGGRKSLGGKNSMSVGRGRPSNTGGSAGAGGKTLLAAAKRHNPAIDKALESVRVEWIKRQLEASAAAKKGNDGGGGEGEKGPQ